MKISFSRISWLSLLAGLAFTPNGWAQSQQAVSSEDFVDSIGVNTHFANCLDSTCIWYSGNFTQITSALTNLGIKNIREGLIPSYASNPTSAYAKELTSLAQAGILVDMITSGTTEQGAIASQVSAIQAINSGTIPVVGAVEGPNESDLDGNFMGGRSPFRKHFTVPSFRIPRRKT